MLKIYEINKGWAGGTVVVAESREDAVELLREWAPGYNFDDPRNVDEHEIKSGLVINFDGDA